MAGISEKRNEENQPTLRMSYELMRSADGGATVTAVGGERCGITDTGRQNYYF